MSESWSSVAVALVAGRKLVVQVIACFVGREPVFCDSYICFDRYCCPREDLVCLVADDILERCLSRRRKIVVQLKVSRVEMLNIIHAVEVYHL